jgi:molybdate transport system substrate-binding protein
MMIIGRYTTCVMLLLSTWFGWSSGAAAETLAIAVSPSVKAPIEALGRAFEHAHSGVTVRLYIDSGLDLRRTIAGMENHPSGKYVKGRGIIHLVAPGGDELITRLASKNYIRPNTQRLYAVEPLVLVIPQSLVEGPASFEALARDASLRIAIADPTVTTLGQQSHDLLSAYGIREAVKARLIVAADSRGVLDHLMRGEADVGILRGPEAVREQERVRITVVADDSMVETTRHSLAMEWQCPDRKLAQAFLDFTQSEAAHTIVRSLGYRSPLDQVRDRSATASVDGH